MRVVYDKMRPYITRAAGRAVARGAGTLLTIGGATVGIGALVIQEQTGAWPTLQPFDVLIGGGVLLGAVVSYAVIAWSLRRDFESLRFRLFDMLLDKTLSGIWDIVSSPSPVKMPQVKFSSKKVQRVLSAVARWLKRHGDGDAEDSA